MIERFFCLYRVVVSSLPVPVFKRQPPSSILYVETNADVVLVTTVQGDEAVMALITLMDRWRNKEGTKGTVMCLFL